MEILPPPPSLLHSALSPTNRHERAPRYAKARQTIRSSNGKRVMSPVRMITARGPGSLTEQASHCTAVHCIAKRPLSNCLQSELLRSWSPHKMEAAVTTGLTSPQGALHRGPCGTQPSCHQDAEMEDMFLIKRKLSNLAWSL